MHYGLPLSLQTVGLWLHFCSWLLVSTQNFTHMHLTLIPKHAADSHVASVEHLESCVFRVFVCLILFGSDNKCFFLQC